MQLNVQQIMEVIPNRYPIMMVDKVIEMEPGKHVVAIKNVTYNEHFFPGHFPGEPVMPGVLILEALAQTGSIPLLMSEEFKGKTGYLGGIDKVKFRQKVVPGDVLRMEMDIIKQKRNIGVGKATAWVEDKKVCEALMTFIIGA
ncbi:3-hydroxyacyl-ACP dehydratase FabZ [Vagococcus acidifermentans]|uniref:3-hydroxyacyl-[acyl-carrier-protein] dehydratase FabZ n=1 Tax=Vagococcus acidifermentans TaxID=564710 RepID=A0A430AXX0_9ENTE|nr:3-hydroxyacyl-ACP dehydratase FabZ [Vagococcus acidifermentans]RSU12912.1 3-hydroxyacyl-[acyl-carrier-protein] dehydratase FabZ [Vagococcus acidifermentans]